LRRLVLRPSSCCAAGRRTQDEHPVPWRLIRSLFWSCACTRVHVILTISMSGCGRWLGGFPADADRPRRRRARAPSFVRLWTVRYRYARVRAPMACACEQASEHETYFGTTRTMYCVVAPHV
jgi:hypothetical protein